MLNLKNKVMKFLCRNLIWIMIKIKLVFLVLILGFSSLNAKVWSQQDRIDLVFENMNMVQLFEQIQQKTNLKFVFNHEDVQPLVEKYITRQYRRFLILFLRINLYDTRLRVIML